MLTPSLRRRSLTVAFRLPYLLVCWFALTCVNVFAEQHELRMADVVGNDGKLNLPEGYFGSINTENYSFYTDGRGAPRFFPSETASTIRSIASGMTAFGAVRHGCGTGSGSTVRAVVRMPNGDLVLGGSFTNCGGVPATDIVRWNGSRWSLLGSEHFIIPYDGIYAMALKGNDLYIVGGDIFNTVENHYQVYIARWDGSNWHSVGCAACVPNGPIHAISVIGNDVYVGGTFNEIQTSATDRINTQNVARWDGTTWHALGSDSISCVSGVGDVVTSLTNDGTNLYVGGAFTTAFDCATASPANHVARWNGTTWDALGNGSSNGVNGTVNALVYGGGNLYAGGSFNVAGASVANSIARWDGAAWHPLISAGANGVSGDVDALTLFNSDLFVAGNFRAAGITAALRVARWNGSIWSAMGNGLGTKANDDDGTVDTVFVDANGVIAGGTFASAIGIDTVTHMAQWNGNAWQPFIATSDFTQIDGRVNAFAVRGTDLYVGGAITRVGETFVNNVARWNGSSWSSLGSAAENGVDGEVFALTTTPTNVYIGGDFSHAGTQVAGHVARWDGGAWHAMGFGTDARVAALAATSDSSVYAGGAFTLADGIAVNSIARWNGNTWVALTSGSTTGVCGTVNALAAYVNGVYVGGHFPTPPCGNATNVGNSVSYWNGVAWFPLKEQFQVGAVDGVSGSVATVSALTVSGDDLYVGGQFLSVYHNGTVQSVPNIVRWRAVGTWDPISGGANTDLSRGVTAIAVAGPRIYAVASAASFASAIVKYEPPQFGYGWYTIATAPYINYSPGALATMGNGVYFGGSFSQVYNNTAVGGTAASARWVMLFEDELFANDFEAP